jgi:hypothetical protein
MSKKYNISVLWKIQLAKKLSAISLCVLKWSGVNAIVMNNISGGAPCSPSKESVKRMVRVSHDPIGHPKTQAPQRLPV